jgi:hypothetical protein
MPLRAYTLRELAMLYKVSKLTFRRWLKPFVEEIGERQGHFYSINQVKIITDRLGTPDMDDH